MDDLTYIRYEQLMSQFFLLLIPILVIICIIWCFDQMRKEAKMKKAEDRSPLPAMSIIILVILTSYTIAKLESILHRSVPYIIQFQQDEGLKNIWELAPRVVWVNIVGDIAFALFCITCFVVAHNYLKENFWVNAKKRRMVTIASYLLLFGGILLAVMAAN